MSREAVIRLAREAGFQIAPHATPEVFEITIQHF